MTPDGEDDLTSGVSKLVGELYPGVVGTAPESVAGLKKWKELMDAGYHGDRTINDLTAFSTIVAGKAAMFYDTSGQMKKVFGKDGDPKLKDQIGSFALPSASKGRRDR